MSETWKKRARAAFRAFEVVLAVALLAVLLELLLVLLNAPGPVPEVRFIRASHIPEEPAAPALIPANLPPAPAQVIPEKPAVKAPPARPPARPPVLLDFENLRRLLGRGNPAPNGTPPGGHGGNGGVPGGAGQSPTFAMLAVAPILIPATNAPPATNTPPSTNNTPDAERPQNTNQVTAVSSNTSTNSDSPVFRLSVP